MSIPPLSPLTLSSLQPQGFSAFEEPVGTKYQENKKCPSFWKKLGNQGEGSREMERWEMSMEIFEGTREQG